MNQFIIKYLTNRRDYYTTLLNRCPYAAFNEALKSATFPFEESDEVLKKIENSEDLSKPDAIPSALLHDDLIKKSEVGQQTAQTTVSIKDALHAAERIENIGFLLFEALAKQELKDKTLWIILAEQRSNCLMNILQLRDDLDFHRLRLP